MTQFRKDVAGPEPVFPAFCLIEPDYNGLAENDDHPPHDVMRAQKLLADVYNAVRANDPLWASTLLVVVYDEHGGFYDHVEPPSVGTSPLPVPPSEPQPDWEYSFDRFGVRVPAVLVSPWVSQGFDATVFDHTSLLKYLIEKWELGPLGNRTARATSIGNLVRTETRNVPFEPIRLTPDQRPIPTLEETVVAHISGHHKALVLLAAWLQLEFLKEYPLLYAWLTYLLV
jgi:phospholipase C